MAAAAMVQVLPAPTTWASSVLPLCRIRQTASFWWRDRSRSRRCSRSMPGKRQMRAVEAAQAQIVEAVVVLAGQPRGALAVFPDPFPEAILQLLLFFAGGDGFLLVDDARSVLVLVIGGRRAAVEGLLDQLGGAEARRAVRRRVGDVLFLAASRSRRSRSRSARRARRACCRARCRAARATNSRMSVAGIQDEPSRASMSPGSRSAGCTASSASILRAIDGVERRRPLRAVASLRRTSPLRYRSAVSQSPPSGIAVDEAAQLALQARERCGRSPAPCAASRSRRSRSARRRALRRPSRHARRACSAPASGARRWRSWWRVWSRDRRFRARAGAAGRDRPRRP